MAKINRLLKTLYEDPKVVYTLLWMTLVIPYLSPLGLPIAVSPRTKTAYDTINALKPGDVIILSVDINAGAWGELGAGGTAIMRHLFEIPGIKIVIVNFDVQGHIFALRILDFIDKHGKEYGKDYVLLGFVPGGKAVGGAALASDIHKVFQKDFYGTDTSSLPMMEKIRSYKDVSVIVDVDWGQGTEAFLYQWVGPYKSKLIAHMTSMMAPTFEPHYNAGNIIGFIVGIRGAAEYELLAKKPGVGVATTDALSASHLLVVLSVIVGNIVYFSMKRRR